MYGNSQYVMAVYSNHTGLDVGDKIKIGSEELEVACVMSEGVGDFLDYYAFIFLFHRDCGIFKRLDYSSTDLVSILTPGLIVLER